MAAAYLPSPHTCRNPGYFSLQLFLKLLLGRCTLPPEIANLPRTQERIWHQGGTCGKGQPRQDAGPNRPLSGFGARSSQRPRPRAPRPSSGSAISPAAAPRRPLRESRLGRGRHGSLPQEPREPLRPPLDPGPGPCPSLSQPPRRGPRELRTNLRTRLRPDRRLPLLARLTGAGRGI